MCEHESEGMWLPLRFGDLSQGLGKRYKLAFSLTELVTLTSDFSIKHAPNCTSSVVRTDPKSLLLVYRVTCRESYSDPRGHKVSIKFDPSKIDDKSTVDNLDVRVQCTCPAFLYWGSQWNLYDAGALYGQPQPLLQPPTEGKRFQNVLCKHLFVVAKKITPVINRLLDRYRDEEAKKKQKEIEKVLQLHEEEAKKEEAKGKNVKVVKDKTPDTTKKLPGKKPNTKEKPNDKGKKEITRNGPVKTYGPSKKKKDEDDDGIIKINSLSSLIPVGE